jgi:transcriptional regulator of arginine metabolism
VKNARQRKILAIIGETDIETQHQLIEALRAGGVAATQATVSRDIKELHLVKELTALGAYRYTSGMSADEINRSSRLRAIFRESVTSVVSAQNIVVMKTLPGLAPAACSAIDGMEIRGLAGSLAGDDTAFLAMRDNETAERFCVEIKEMMK